MVEYKQVMFGFLFILLATGVIYVQFAGKTQLRIDKDKSTFYVNQSGWKISGVENLRLFNGTKIVNRITSGIEIWNETRGNEFIIYRKTPYQGGAYILSTWIFDSTEEDISYFPKNESHQVVNGQGLYFRYSLDQLKDTGVKRKLTTETYVKFGMNMRLTFPKGYAWAWIGYPYGGDSFSVQYKVPDDVYTYNIRFFDPSSIYYVCPTGDDTNDGLTDTTPFKTITKVNTLTLVPGDSVLFCNGGIWESYYDARLSIKPGNSTKNITYGAYGTGDFQPQIYLYRNASYSNNWTSLGGNYYQTTFTISSDVGDIFMNGNPRLKNWQYYGIKNATGTTLTTTRQYYYNASNDKVVMYSPEGNPGTVYAEVLMVYDSDIIDLGADDYVIIQDITVGYTGAHGIAGSYNDYVVIQRVNMMFIGGSYHDEPTRYGNGVQFGLNSSNCKVLWSNFTEVYDAAMTPQCWSSAGDHCLIKNLEFAYNIVDKSAYGFEYFNSNITHGQTYNISVHHNTFTKMCDNHLSYYRLYERIRLASNPTQSGGFNFSNNIYDDSCYRLFDISTSWSGPLPVTDYNLYYNRQGIANIFQVKSNSYSSLVAYTAATGNDSHGFEGDPLFTDFDNGDYRPVAGSPACAMSSTGSYVGALPCTTTGVVLYVNKSKSTCSDSNTWEQARDPSTPWCSASSTTTAKMLEGDTMYIVGSNSNATNIYRTELKVANMNFPVNTTIAAYPGTNPIITRAIEKFFNPNSTVWTNVSNKSINMWSSPVSSSLDCFFGWYGLDGEDLYATCDGFEICEDSVCTPGREENFSWFNSSKIDVDGLWFDNTNNILYIKFKDLTKNPNNIVLTITSDSAVEINNVTGPQKGTGLIIANLSIQGGWEAFYYLGASSNVTTIGNRIHQQYRGMECSGDSSWLTSYKDEYYAKPSSEWTWAMAHSTPQENTVLTGYNCKGNVSMQNITAHGLYNVIVPGFNGDITDWKGLDVGYSTFYEIYDDVFEPEPFANCFNFHNNFAHDVHVVMSMTPSNSSVCNSTFEGNIAIANLSVSGSVRTFKFSEDNNNATRGWTIKGNTLYGRDGIYQSTAAEEIMYGVTSIDNILLGNGSQRLMDRSGTARQNNHYNYNLYWNPGGVYFQYWDSDTISTEYSSLAAAKASGRGVDWDNQSKDEDPLLNMNTFQPSSDSPACAASSTGNQIGAVPCAVGEETMELVTMTGNCNTTAYIVTPNYNMTLKEGVGCRFFYNSLDDFDWGADSTCGGTGIGAIYSTSFITSNMIDSSCQIISNNGTMLKLRIYNANAESNITFYPSYIKREDLSKIGTMRVYDYLKVMGADGQGWNSTGKLAVVSGFTNLYDANGIYAVNATENRTSNIFVHVWDQTKTTGYGYQAGAGTVTGLSIGRPAEVAANTTLISYFAVLAPNSTATGDNRVISIINAFKGDPTLTSGGSLANINVRLNGLEENRTYERQSTIEISFNSSISPMCLDILHPDFGSNYKCVEAGVTGQENIVVDKLYNLEFNDTSTTKTLTTNKSVFSILSNLADTKLSWAMNITGLGFTKNPTLDVGNDGGKDYKIWGELTRDGILNRYFSNGNRNEELIFTAAGQSILRYINVTADSRFEYNLTLLLLGRNFVGDFILGFADTIYKEPLTTESKWDTEAERLELEETVSKFSYTEDHTNTRPPGEDVSGMTIATIFNLFDEDETSYTNFFLHNSYPYGYTEAVYNVTFQLKNATPGATHVLKHEVWEVSCYRGRADAINLYFKNWTTNSWDKVLEYSEAARTWECSSSGYSLPISTYTIPSSYINATGGAEMKYLFTIASEGGSPTSWYYYNVYDISGFEIINYRTDDTQETTTTTLFQNYVPLDNVTIYVNTSNQAGDSVTVLLSNDNGVTYGPSAPLNQYTKYNFTANGTTFKAKITLGTTLSNQTPYLKRITLFNVTGDYPNNISVDFGDDGTYDYIGSETINATPKIRDLTNNISTPYFEYYSDFCEDAYIDPCIVPIRIRSSTSGLLNFSFNLTTLPGFSNKENLAILNLTEFNTYCTASPCEVKTNITWESGGNMTFNNLQLAYYGDGTFTIVARDNATTVNKTLVVTLIDSAYNRTLPYTWTPSIFIQPSGIGAKNVTPYGQSQTTPIVNIRGEANTYGMTIGVMIDNTNACVNYTVSNSSTKSNGKVYQPNNNSYQTICSMSTPTGTCQNFIWADLNGCNASQVRMLRPNITWQSCCEGCVACW